MLSLPDGRFIYANAIYRHIAILKLFYLLSTLRFERHLYALHFYMFLA